MLVNDRVELQSSKTVTIDTSKCWLRFEHCGHTLNSREKSGKVKMHFLPPYSPNLNPIERLWKFTNERLLYNKYYEKFSDFKKAI